MGSNWVVYAGAAVIAIPFLALVAWIVATRLLTENARRRLVAIRQSRRLPLIMAIVVPAGFLLIVSIVLAPFGGSMFIRVLKNLPMAGMFAGMQFLALSRRPVGDRLRCSRCKYDLSGLPPGPSSGPNGRHDGKCPECGGQWGWAGGSEKAVRVWSWKWLAAGVILLLPLFVQFVSAPVMGVLWWDGVLLRIVPTPSLVEEVLTQRSFTMAAWAELAKRAVSPEDTDRIARKLLLRPGGSYYTPDEAGWLKSSLTARLLDPKLVEPRLEQMFTVAAARGPTIGGVRLTLTPHPEQAPPFTGLEACVVVGPRSGGRPDQLAPLVLACGGPGMYKPCVLPTVEVDRGTPQERFAGMITVILQTPGAPRVRLHEDGRVEPIAGALYRVDVPVEVPVEQGK